MKIIAIGAAAVLMLGGAAYAQNSHDGTHHDLGGSMGTQSSATPQSHAASMASGAHQTPVAKAGRRQSSRSTAMRRHSTPPATSTSGSADMTPSGNATANQQH